MYVWRDAAISRIEFPGDVYQWLITVTYFSFTPTVMDFSRIVAMYLVTV